MNMMQVSLVLSAFSMLLIPQHIFPLISCQGPKTLSGFMSQLAGGD